MDGAFAPAIASGSGSGPWAACQVQSGLARRNAKSRSRLLLAPTGSACDRGRVAPRPDAEPTPVNAYRGQSARE